MSLPYANRDEAGRVLASRLEHYQGRDDVIVLALPRGGVPLATAVADALDAGLDVMMVRKIGTPGHRELAMGAIASGGVCLRNEQVIRLSGVSDADFDEVKREEEKELRRREEVFRGDWPYPDLEGKCVILVDDGLATGSTMRAAVAATRKLGPAEIVVAVAVAPPDTVADFEREVDEVVCPATPADFGAIGRFYEDFSQLGDEEVRGMLKRARRKE